VFKITVDRMGWVDTQFNSIAKGLGRTYETLNSPFLMAAGVSPIARRWSTNFTSGGSLVGGWKPLSAYTQRVRQDRGYGADHPILRQSGALYRGAIDSFIKWGLNKNNLSVRIDPTPLRTGNKSPYGGGDLGEAGYSGETYVSGQTYSRTFSASIQGAKAMNQIGGPVRFASGSGWVNMPARPFWFFDQEGLDGALEQISKYFVANIFEGMPESTVTSVYSMSAGRTAGL